MYEQPTLEIAQEAARLIRQRLDTGQTPAHTTITLTGRLIVGASVRTLHVPSVSTPR
jgi:DNA-binding LacI/PurR family transcriptional regulator